jgi:multidrug transporter EmrE-like cation transporter
MSTLYLGLAIIFEATWAIAMKYSNGFSKPIPAIIMMIAFALSAVFLALAARKFGVSTAYAVWVGGGAVIIATVGMFYFNEPRSALKIISLCLVVLGVVGLKLSGGEIKPQ